MSSSAPSRSAGEQAKTLWGFGFGRLLCYGWMDGAAEFNQSECLSAIHTFQRGQKTKRLPTDRPTDRLAFCCTHSIDRSGVTRECENCV